MSKKKSKAKKYGIEVLTYHQVSVNWLLSGGHKDNLDYKRKVHDKIDAHWYKIREKFPGVTRIWPQASMGMYFWQYIELRGDNPETVMAAGKAMAKKIFSYRHVESV
jgi:hypothetical protein